MLHWAVIATSAILAILSAWLVFMESWDSWNALLTVGVGAIALLLLLLGVLLLFNPKHRQEIWNVVWQTCLQDLKDMLKMLGIGREK
jgi:hypothetical protein